MPRPGRPEDAEAVAEVYLAVWRVHGQELRGGHSVSAEAEATRQPELGGEALREQADRFGGFLQTRERQFLVADAPASGAGSGLGGFVSYGPSYTRAGYGEVMQLYVHPEWQGRGIGSSLLVEAWAAMAQESWASSGSHVWCTKGNPANRVYEKAGWAPTGREKSLQPSLSASLVEVCEYCAPAARPPSAASSASGRLRGCVAAAAALVLLLALALAAWPLRWGRGGGPAGAGQAELARGAPDELDAGEGANVGRAVRLVPLAADSAGASCLDGSDPRLYHRPARAGGQSERRWLLYFQGGGWCVPGAGVHGAFPPTLVDRCGERSATIMGSTRRDHETKNFTEKALFSQDESANPIFHDWHAVFIRYCDGASFANAVGAANFRAALGALLDLGLAAASDVVVSGCSAGAVAAALHAGAVQQALPTAFVTALVDSGMFLDWSRPAPEGSAAGAGPQPPSGQPPAGIWPVGAELRRAFEERGYETAGVMPAACLARYAGETWKCLFLEYVLPFVEVPAFLLQSRFDSSNVRGIDDAAGLEAFGASMAWRLEQALEESHGRHALFLDSCFHHCMSWGDIHAEASANPREDPVSQPVAFSAWWHHLRAQRHGRGAADEEPPAAAGRRWRWDHLCRSGSGPCWDADRCPTMERDVRFWRQGFSEAAGGGTTRGRGPPATWG